MKIIEIEQGTGKWLMERKQRIGASDACVIMGKSKFMTPLQLFEQKTNPDYKRPPMNFIQAKGHDKEKKCRARIELITDKDWPAIVCLHSDYDFLIVSLDGYNQELNEVWECKFVGEDDFKTVCSGIMLEKYYPQVQMQLAVTGAKLCRFWCINEQDETHELIIYPDVPYIKNELYPALFSFWEKIQNKEKPELTENDLVDFSGDENLVILLEEYKLFDETEKKYKEQKDAKKEEILKIVGKGKAICNGIKITTSKGEDKEVVDYEKMVTDLKLDTAPFMKIKKGLVSSRITFPKDVKSE